MQDSGTELWAGRLAALARLARADGLAVFLHAAGDRPRPYAAHNLRADGTWAHGPAEQLAALSLEQRAIQHRPGLEVLLADGRIGRSALAVPIISADRPVGTLLLVRAAEPFARSDAEPATRVADLVAIELAGTTALQQANARVAESDGRVRAAETDRAHAIALYEIARIAAVGEDRDRALERAAAVLADTFALDLVTILASEPDGTLRPVAARGYPGLTPAPIRAASDAVLVRVALGMRSENVHHGPGEGPAWTGGMSDILACPIIDRGLARGVLVLGRAGRPFTQPERDLAPTLAETLGALVGMPEVTPVAPPVAAAAIPVAPAATAATAVAEAEPAGRAPAPIRRQTGSRIGTVLLVLLAIGTATAGLLGAGPLAYLAAAVLLLIALVSFRQ